MTSEEMKKRTKRFAIAIVRFAQTLPKDSITAIMTRQLVKSGTSVGANYRSSCRAKSAADFISKMTTAEEEGDETLFWLEVLVEAEIARAAEVAGLLDEADQLVRISVASTKTKRANMANPQSNPKSEINYPKSRRGPRAAARAATRAMSRRGSTRQSGSAGTGSRPAARSTRRRRRTLRRGDWRRNQPRSPTSAC